ncbi:MAG: hypothetical protein JXC36_05985 [Candidatus Atribacteria bacterium]|nr:hypothetical protein [Candidatus Atribacteria bacterium]
MRIQNKETIVHKLVYEVRYNYGYTYLDRCGRTINRIMRERPEWSPHIKEPNPQNAPLINTKSKSIFNFSALKYDLSLEQQAGIKEALTKKDITEFQEQADYLSKVINDELGLHEFTRIGFRIWYLIATESNLDSDRWVSNLGIIKIDDLIKDIFSGTVENRNFTIVFKGEDRKFQISVNSVERKGIPSIIDEDVLKVPARQLPKNQQKHLIKQVKAKQTLSSNPSYAVMIDVDSYIENPESIDAVDFINNSIKQIESNVPKIFNKKG